MYQLRTSGPFLSNRNPNYACEPTPGQGFPLPRSVHASAIIPQPSSGTTAPLVTPRGLPLQSPSSSEGVAPPISQSPPPRHGLPPHPGVFRSPTSLTSGSGIWNPGNSRGLSAYDAPNPGGRSVHTSIGDGSHTPVASPPSSYSSARRFDSLDASDAQNTLWLANQILRDRTLISDTVIDHLQGQLVLAQAQIEQLTTLVQLQGLQSHGRVLSVRERSRCLFGSEV